MCRGVFPPAESAVPATAATPEEANVSSTRRGSLPESPESVVGIKATVDGFVCGTLDWGDVGDPADDTGLIGTLGNISLVSLAVDGDGRNIAVC